MAYFVTSSHPHDMFRGPGAVASAAPETAPGTRQQLPLLRQSSGAADCSGGAKGVPCYGKSPFLMGKSTINGHFQLLC